MISQYGGIKVCYNTDILAIFDQKDSNRHKVQESTLYRSGMIQLKSVLAVT